jgi:hypothetical protein
MSLRGHVSRGRERRNVDRLLAGKPEGERDHLKDPGVDYRIILKWIFKKWAWGHGLD